MPIFVRILLGVEHLHHHQLLHRDLKPSNIFVGGEDIVIGDLENVVRADKIDAVGVGTTEYMYGFTLFHARSYPSANNPQVTECSQLRGCDAC
jgi:serine/threonine protein kinase